MIINGHSFGLTNFLLFPFWGGLARSVGGRLLNSVSLTAEQSSGDGNLDEVKVGEVRGNLGYGAPGGTEIYKTEARDAGRRVRGPQYAVLK